jgi:hypothetical protein
VSAGFPGIKELPAVIDRRYSSDCVLETLSAAILKKEEEVLHDEQSHRKFGRGVERVAVLLFHVRANR